MTLRSSPLSSTLFDTIDWPGDASVVLVLDPCLIPNLSRALFDWSNDVYKVDCLYDNTPWEPLRDVSPWAVWLSGPDDPFLQHFTEHEAPRESGYLVFTPLSYPEFSRWMRQRIHIERAPEAMELVRIGHPALAAEIIGDHLIRTHPEGAVQRMILPDRTTGQWRHVVPKTGEASLPEPAKDISLSSGLFDAFARFNLRRANLMIWDGLDDPIRRALGGTDLPDAWPQLCRLSGDAGNNGRHDTRGRTQYIRRHCKQGQPAERDF